MISREFFGLNNLYCKYLQFDTIILFKFTPSMSSKSICLQLNPNWSNAREHNCSDFDLLSPPNDLLRQIDVIY